MHNKIMKFAENMQHELNENEYKGNWEEFTDTKDIIVELEYHKSKLLIALKENDLDKIKEYIADCSNILLCLANSRDLLD